MLGGEKSFFLENDKQALNLIDKNSQLHIDIIFANCLYLIWVIMIFNIIYTK
jgi:hypothetical protein